MTTQEVRDKIWELHQSGVSLTKIAEMTGVSRSTAYNVTKEIEAENLDDFLEDEDDFSEIEELEKEVKKNGGLSGAELIDLHRAKLEGTMKVMDYRHKLREERKNNDHKRQMDILKAQEELKAKEARRAEAQKEREKIAKAEKAFYAKKEELDEQVLEFVNTYLGYDKQDITAGDIAEQIEVGRSLRTEITKLLKSAGRTKEEIAENEHLKAIEVIGKDYVETIGEDYDEDDEIEFTVERAMKAKVSPILKLEGIQVDFE
jgi:transposase